MSENIAGWIKITDSDNINLPKMLDFSSANYQRHTDWFLKHKDMGLKSLALILTAEYSVLGLHFSKEDFPKFLTCLSLILLGVFSVLIAISTYRSCMSAFKASLESAVQITKTVWAMGLAEPVSIEKRTFISMPPVPDDIMLYVRRYYDDASKNDCGTTEKFVKWNMKKHTTTYFWGKITIIVFCSAAIITAAIGIGAVYIPVT